MEKNSLIDLKTQCELIFFPLHSVPLMYSQDWYDGLTVDALIQASGFSKLYPEVDTLCVGIFSRLVSREMRLKAGDRVEIYRPLLIDPKEKRRRQAKQSKTS